MLKIGNVEIDGYPVLMAPMEDVTDPPYRQICKRFGADIMYTEFISSDGLIRDAHKSLKKLDFIEEERPLGIQIFGSDIDSLVQAAQMAEEAKPDLIDINFGCPVRKVAMKGGGAGLLNDIPKMIAITEAVVKSVKIPVTAKTRLGWDDKHKEIVDIAERLQDAGAQALTIHGRTRAQMYKGVADWTLIGEVKNNPRMHIPIIGNGDITGPEIAKQRFDEYGVDGIMIGRGIMGNPWIFRSIKHYLNTGEILPPPDISERVDVCKEHLQRSIEWKQERTAVFEMRKHYMNYFKGYPGFKAYRIKLVETMEAAEIFDILEEVRERYSR